MKRMDGTYLGKIDIRQAAINRTHTRKRLPESRAFKQPEVHCWRSMRHILGHSLLSLLNSCMVKYCFYSQTILYIFMEKYVTLDTGYLGVGNIHP